MVSFSDHINDGDAGVKTYTVNQNVWAKLPSDAEKLLKQVKIWGKDASTYQPLFQRTNGVQLSVTSDFGVELKDYILDLIKASKEYTAVVAHNLTTVKISQIPEKDSAVDFDGDGIPDGKEIDWSKIKIENNLMVLPLLKDYLLGKLELKLLRDSKIGEKLLSIRVLSLYSDPTKKDGDGYFDPDDPMPLHSNVTVYSIRNVEYLPMEYNGVEEHEFEKGVYYGGNQSWFYDTAVNKDRTSQLIENGGCGIIAASDILLYLARTEVTLRTLGSGVNLSDVKVKYEGYNTFIRKMEKEYIQPLDIYAEIYRG